jgi:hypothetical protein
MFVALHRFCDMRGFAVVPPSSVMEFDESELGSAPIV